MYRLLLRSLLLLNLLGYSVPPLADSALRPIPKPDLSTPENALKSYWALKNWEVETLHTEVTKLRTSGFEAAAPHIAKITTGAAQKHFATLIDPPYVILERQIDEVTLVTIDQVIVLVTIRNITAIPTDARPTKAQLNERELGRKFKYVLVLDGKDWKVSEAWKLGGPEPFMYDRMLFETLPSHFPSDVWYD